MNGWWYHGGHQHDAADLQGGLAALLGVSRPTLTIIWSWDRPQYSSKAGKVAYPASVVPGQQVRGLDRHRRLCRDRQNSTRSSLPLRDIRRRAQAVYLAETGSATAHEVSQVADLLPGSGGGTGRAGLVDLNRKNSWSLQASRSGCGLPRGNALSDPPVWPARTCR